MNREHDPDEPQVARLADNSLPDVARDRLAASVDGSAPLAEALAEQRHALTLLSAFDEPAPAALRASVKQRIGARATRTRRRSMLLLPGAAALALGSAAIVVALGGGGAGPTVTQAARFTLAAATLPAPAIDSANPTRLRTSAAGLPFPNWSQDGGWQAVGARSDALDGRRVRTVFYANRGGLRVGYAIVGGRALPPAPGTTVTLYGGARFTLADLGRARMITWRRAGHTCVIAGRSVSDAVLEALAARESAGAAGSASVSGRPWL